MSTLKEGVDFYYDTNGHMVLTAAYLKKRGHCCESGCLHCPYGYTERVDPSVPRELQNPWDTSDEGHDESHKDDHHKDDDDLF